MESWRISCKFVTRFSVSWWSFASMCSSAGRCLLTRRNHINIHMCSRSYCCRGKLLKNSSSCSFDTLSVSSRKSCANLIVILAMVTAAATRLAFPLHTTWSITSEGLRHGSFSTQVVVRARRVFDNACSSSQNNLFHSFQLCLESLC